MASLSQEIVVLDGESYLLSELPDSNSRVVVIEKFRLLGAIDLEALFNDLDQLSNYVRIAYHSVAGFTELQIKIQQISYDVTKLCDKSAITIGKLKKASSTVLSALQATYQYLLENFEDMALETLADVSDTAKGMAESAQELHDDFERQAKVVESAIGDLKSLSTVMLQAALFWEQMHAHCGELAKNKMKKNIEKALKMPEERRLRFWTSNGFKGNAVRYYAGWVALDDVCTVYMERIKLTQQELYTYIQEALCRKEARKKVKELARNFSADLEKQQRAVDDKKFKHNQEIKALQENEEFLEFT